MMKAPGLRHGEDFALLRRFDVARLGTILVECPMDSVTVKILEIVGQDSPQMISMEHNQMVHALPPDRSDPALNNWILPG